ncbi:O-acyltransferase [Bacteroidia bacterium]|nr:O-acyltransferase [Bacteroidia bacterium]
MLFNSFDFAIFMTLVFVLFWSVFAKTVQSRNVFLLVISYAFYAYANWKILPLLLVSTLVFYWLGIAIHRAKNDKKKSLLTTLGIVAGVAVLMYFKYTNFFITSFKDLFESMGMQVNIHSFNIIVPIGISFYTFRLLSYVIDINRNKYEPTQDIIAFSTYVAFFPCILSGPIDRPDTFIPQLQSKRSLDYSLLVDGLRQILWGFFKKMVIADHCANIVNAVWEHHSDCSSGTLILTAVLYAFQMYADFSGYTDMAIGIAKTLGFRVTKNFNHPFLAQNVADFWRRWHISLTSWLTDYVFMPLNVAWRNWGKFGMILAIIVDFIICGLWHGANWTFVLWGTLHGLLFIPLILSGIMNKKQKLETNTLGLPTLKVFGKMLLTFVIIALGMIIFRADSIHQAVEYLSEMCSFATIENAYEGLNQMEVIFSICMVIGLMLYEFAMEKHSESLQTWFGNIPGIFRWFVYLLLLLSIVYLGEYGGGNENTFIYFRF